MVLILSAWVLLVEIIHVSLLGRVFVHALVNQVA